MAKNQVLCHIVDDNFKELAKPARVKKGAQEFNYKKRMWAISEEAIQWTDHRGISHYFVNINQSDGVIRWLDPIQFNQYEFIGENKVKFRDVCDKCGDRITYDARNVRDMLKRKTVDTFWGIDQSHMLIIILMGIIAVAGMGGAFYLLGQNNNLTRQVADLQSKLVPVTPDTNTVTGKFLLPFIGDMI